MRLDHLLSKEHVTASRHGVWCRAAPGPRWPVTLDGLHASGVVLEGGTLTSSAGIVSLLLVRPFGVWNAVVGGVRSVGTLLGPEGAEYPLSRSGPIVCRTAAVPVGMVGLAAGLRSVFLVVG